jgi:hypothetical protein
VSGSAEVNLAVGEDWGGPLDFLAEAGVMEFLPVAVGADDGEVAALADEVNLAIAADGGSRRRGVRA